MRVLLAGRAGQLGRQALSTVPGDVELLAPPEDAFDITDESSVRAVVDDGRPQWIINAAAYTAVDAAEQDRDNAFRINADGPETLARVAAEAGARLLHVSTDFVFDGCAGRPYRAEDRPAPLSVYGESKLAGERRAAAVLGESLSIVRTAWVYAPGGRNFVRTMLRLAAERSELRVVDDQVGSPTHAVGLAEAVWALITRAEQPGGIWHWTDAGVASWYDLARAVVELAAERWPERSWASVMPIGSEDYPTPARRPSYSVLDCRPLRALAGTPPHWRERLRHALRTDPPEDWLGPSTG